MTLYTVARSDGDNRILNLTQSEAANAICEIAWEQPRNKCIYNDEEIIRLACERKINADCQDMNQYVVETTDQRDDWAAFAEKDPDDDEAKYNLIYFNALLAECAKGRLFYVNDLSDLIRKTAA